RWCKSQRARPAPSRAALPEQDLRDWERRWCRMCRAQTSVGSDRAQSCAPRRSCPRLRAPSHNASASHWSWGAAPLRFVVLTSEYVSCEVHASRSCGRHVTLLRSCAGAVPTLALMQCAAHKPSAGQWEVLMSEDTLPRRKFLLGAGLAGTAIATGMTTDPVEAAQQQPATPQTAAPPAPDTES